MAVKPGGRRGGWFSSGCVGERSAGNTAGGGDRGNRLHGQWPLLDLVRGHAAHGAGPWRSGVGVSPERVSVNNVSPRPSPERVRGGVYQSRAAMVVVTVAVGHGPGGANLLQVRPRVPSPGANRLPHVWPVVAGQLGGGRRGAAFVVGVCVVPAVARDDLADLPVLDVPRVIVLRLCAAQDRAVRRDGGGRLGSLVGRGENGSGGYRDDIVASVAWGGRDRLPAGLVSVEGSRLWRAPCRPALVLLLDIPGSTVFSVVNQVAPGPGSTVAASKLLENGIPANGALLRFLAQGLLVNVHYPSLALLGPFPVSRGRPQRLLVRTAAPQRVDGGLIVRVVIVCLPGHRGGRTRRQRRVVSTAAMNHAVQRFRFAVNEIVHYHTVTVADSVLARTTDREVGIRRGVLMTAATISLARREHAFDRLEQCRHGILLHLKRTRENCSFFSHREKHL